MWFTPGEVFTLAWVVVAPIVLGVALGLEFAHENRHLVCSWDSVFHGFLVAFLFGAALVNVPAPSRSYDPLEHRLCQCMIFVFLLGAVASASAALGVTARLMRRDESSKRPSRAVVQSFK